MAFDVWVELVCANCSETTGGRHTYGDIPRRQMLRDAMAVGWVKGGPGDEELFCCSECEDDYLNFSLEF